MLENITSVLIIIFIFYKFGIIKDAIVSLLCWSGIILAIWIIFTNPYLLFIAGLFIFISSICSSCRCG